MPRKCQPEDWGEIFSTENAVGIAILSKTPKLFRMRMQFLEGKHAQ